MNRYLGLDIGSVRIGVAVSDPLGNFAQGIAVLPAKDEWMIRLGDLIGQYSVKGVVVGLPLRTDGTEGPEVVRMRDKVEKLKGLYPDVEFIFYDERFTTTVAHQVMREGAMDGRKRRKKVDQVAAVILLQDFLDSRRGSLS